MIFMRILVFLSVFFLNFIFCVEFSDFSGKKLSQCQNVHIAENMANKELYYCDLKELAYHMQSEDIKFSSIKALVDGKFIKNPLYTIENGNLKVLKDEKKELKILDLDSAFSVAYELKSKEIEAKRSKNLKKFYPMGKRIYEKLCPEISLVNFAYISQLKAEIIKKCKDLDDRKAQLVAEFLWANLSGDAIKFEAFEHEKCPVCGMFVYKYPRWAAVFGELDSKDRLVFDGVKDAMKFYFDYEKYGRRDFKFNGGFVSDYYTGNMIDITKAYFVAGSDVLGPMGDELIAFLNQSDARAFRLEHRGREILKFDDITKCVVLDLDGKSCEKE